MRKDYLLWLLLSIYPACSHGSEPEFDWRMFTHESRRIYLLKPFTKETNYMSTIGYLRYLLLSARNRETTRKIEGTVWTNGNMDIYFGHGGKVKLVHRTFYRDGDKSKLSKETHVFTYSWAQEGNYVSIKSMETFLDGTPRSMYEGSIEKDIIMGLVGRDTPMLWSVSLWEDVAQSK